MNPNRPEPIDLHDEMIGERVDFVKSLSPEEILETEELKEADDYMKKLQIEGGATPQHAAIFAVAILGWHNYVLQLVTEALVKSKKK